MKSTIEIFLVVGLLVLAFVLMPMLYPHIGILSVLVLVLFGVVILQIMK